MGISGIIFITFLLGILLLLIGFMTKNKALKVLSIIAFFISLGLFFLVWNALGHM